MQRFSVLPLKETLLSFESPPKNTQGFSSALSNNVIRFYRVSRHNLDAASPLKTKTEEHGGGIARGHDPDNHDRSAGDAVSLLPVKFPCPSLYAVNSTIANPSTSPWRQISKYF